MRTARPLVAAIVAVLLVAGACGDDEDPGDLEAFCGLIEDGTGLLVAADDVAAGSRADEFADLLAVAPPEVRSSLSRILNRERDLGEIVELDELFDAAFSPQALQARTDYRDYVLANCGIDVGEVIVEEEVSLVRGLRSHVADRNAGERWVSEVTYSESNPFLQDRIVTVTFRTLPLGDEAVRACNAASGYLYDELGDNGSVIAVVHNDEVVVQRAGSDAACAPPR